MRKRERERKRRSERLSVLFPLSKSFTKPTCFAVSAIGRTGRDPAAL